MMGLTGWQPYFWAIAEGLKRVENRPWPPPHGMIGQRIAIHAGKTWDEGAYAVVCERVGMAWLPPAARLTGIVAVATIADCTQDQVALLGVMRLMSALERE